MERKINITFIISALSSLIIILMITYMLVNINSLFIKVLFVLEFMCDFYFVTIFFYKMKHFKKFEKIFYAFVAIIPFMISILNIFYMVNFFSPERVFIRNPIISSFLTGGYHYLFLLYISHIIYFFYLFALDNKKTFSSITISVFSIFSSITLAIIFIVLYTFLYTVFANKIITTYKTTKENILYEAGNTFLKETPIDDIEYSGFSKSYDILMFYQGNDLKYSSEDWETYKKQNLLFETSVIQGNGFLFILNGKTFISPFYIFVLIYAIVLSFILTSFIFFSRFFLHKHFESYISIIIKGFKEENYMYAIDTENMEESELKTLSEVYNDKLLPYKYRERYMKMLIK